MWNALFVNIYSLIKKFQHQYVIVYINIIILISILNDLFKKTVFRETKLTHLILAFIIPQFSQAK